MRIFCAYKTIDFSKNVEFYIFCRKKGQSSVSRTVLCYPPQSKVKANVFQEENGIHAHWCFQNGHIPLLSPEGRIRNRHIIIHEIVGMGTTKL